MYTRRDSFAMTPCWFKGAHQPEGRRRREEDGSVLCTCRFCRKEIRSREGKPLLLVAQKKKALAVAQTALQAPPVSGPG